MKLNFSKEVIYALENDYEIIALESTIITHGLPKPQNLKLALELEQIAKEKKITPATIAIIDGHIKVGLEKDELVYLANLQNNCHKFSSFDLPVAQGLKLTGSTTVAGTCHIAQESGIKIFATGGIGGVHKQEHTRMDISHDLKSLSEHPIIVISSGAKCILDLESTLEYLETIGVVHIGWKTDEFPAFYYNNSNLKLSQRVDTHQQILDIAQHLTKSALLVSNPVPEKYELSKEYIEPLILKAHIEAKSKRITGKNLTPFLLEFLCEQSSGRTLTTNCELIKNNVRLAVSLAQKLNKKKDRTSLREEY